MFFNLCLFSHSINVIMRFAIITFFCTSLPLCIYKKDSLPIKEKSLYFYIVSKESASMYLRFVSDTIAHYAVLGKGGCGKFALLLDIV